MKKIIRITGVVLLLNIVDLMTIPVELRAQDREARIIEFPDIPGYMTLKCDFHIQTVFSDGSVWPNLRIHEVVRDGLDAISITDHLEYQPK